MKYKSECAEPISCSERRLQSSGKPMPHDTMCSQHFRNHATQHPLSRLWQDPTPTSSICSSQGDPASCILPKPPLRTAQPMSIAVLSAHSPFNRRKQLNLPIYLNVLHFLQLKLYNIFFTKTLNPAKGPGDANSCAESSGNIWDREHERKHACPCNITRA